MSDLFKAEVDLLGPHNFNHSVLSEAMGLCDVIFAVAVERDMSGVVILLEGNNSRAR